MSEPINAELTREELYNQVWSTPMRVLASQYGLSDVGLAKICKKYDIPKPSVGYWVKREHGKTVKQPRLPKSEFQGTIKLKPSSSPNTLPSGPPGEVGQQPKQNKEKITVSETLRGAHRLVRQAREEYQGLESDEHGLIEIPEDSSLNLKVSKSQLHRVLRIMDAILKALEQREYENLSNSQVRIQDVEVHYFLLEKLETVKEQPDEHDLTGRYQFGHSRYNRKKVPSGRLEIQILDEGDYYINGCRKTWRDTKTKQLENLLNGFVDSLEDYAHLYLQREEREKQEELARKEKERLRREEALRREKIREAYKAERAKVDQLLKQADDWKKSQVLREFIISKKQQYLKDHTRIEPQSEFDEWVTWASAQADRLDPLALSPPSILDEVVGNLEENHRRFWSR